MTFVEKVLELLQHQAEETVDLLDSMTTDRSTSYRKMRRYLRRGSKEFKSNWADMYRKRQKFYSLLNYLKKEGLVEKKIKKNKSLWEITKRGIARLGSARERRANPFSSLNCNYSEPTGTGFTIVAFDVPEKDRRKRKWLRISLASMNFKFLQKSVWVGNGKVPEEFIYDLRHHNMLDYVHIFSLSKGGTIRQIK